MPLTQYQQEDLQEKLDWCNKYCFKYGDPVKTNNNEKPCLRITKEPKWAKELNETTKHPAYLKAPHVSYMVHHNEELPYYKVKELCHRCVGPNPQDVDRQESGALCFEATHLDLRSHADNKGQEKCHEVINDFQIAHRNNSDIKTRGTIYVADVTRLDPDVDHVCKHEPPCFGNYGKIKPTRRSKRLKKKGKK